MAAPVLPAVAATATAAAAAANDPLVSMGRDDTDRRRPCGSALERDPGAEPDEHGAGRDVEVAPRTGSPQQVRDSAGEQPDGTVDRDLEDYEAGSQHQALHRDA